MNQQMNSKKDGTPTSAERKHSSANAESRTTGSKPMFEIKGGESRCCPKCLLRYVHNRVACACIVPFAVCVEFPVSCNSQCPKEP